MRAVLYCRVSSEEQVKGFSLPEQLHDLRRESERRGYDVVAEVEDPGYSRSTLNRPGMDRVRSLVAEGDVDVVLAWKRDRFGAAPWPGLLEAEFAVMGAALRALDDSGEGDDAEFLSGIKDLMARRELKDMVRRTRMGKAGKVRSGKLVGSGPASYGFRWALDSKGKRTDFTVDEKAMAAVRRLFELVASGLPMYRAGRVLEAEGHAAPKGGRWRVGVICRILKRDCYKAHSVEELRELGVAEDVLAGLNPGGVYGVSWFGTRRVTGPARGPRTYRKTPRSEWVAVPNTDAGIPGEHVEAARDAIKDNPAPDFSRGAREWELNGGMALCGECGRTMTTLVSGARAKSRYFYYCCTSGRAQGPLPASVPRCPHRKSHRAETLEEEIARLVDAELLCDAATLTRWFEDAEDGHRASRVDPKAVERALSDKLSDLDAREERLFDAMEDGTLPKDKLAGRLERIEEERETLREELGRERGEAKGAAAREHNRRAILEAFGTGLQLGVVFFPPALRRQLYAALGLRALVHPDGSVELEGSFDEATIRITKEIAEYAVALAEADERLQRREAEDPPEGYEVAIVNPDGTPGTLRVEASAERVERLERELERVKRKFVVDGATSG